MKDEEVLLTFTALASLDGPAKKIAVPTEPKKRKPRAVWTPTAVQIQMMGRCPSGAAKVLRTIYRVESRVIRGIASGSNPFDREENGPAHIAFDLLLHGPTTQTDIRMAFSERLGWGHKPSAVRASVTIRALRELRLIVDDGGCIKLNPRINHNTISLDNLRE